MGYMHIENLYRAPGIFDILRKVYAMEKIHGTSTHVSWKDGELSFFSGGLKHESFVAVFDQQKLKDAFTQVGHNGIIVFGEGYGGKCQAMSHTYGVQTRFVAFDVKIGETWLTVPDAKDVCDKLGFDFVDYTLIDLTIDAVNAERDKPSVQAKKNGILEDKLREGIVIRPIVELRNSRGDRVMFKHKRDEFRETKTPREINPEKAKVMEHAESVALEYVTDMRMNHVLDKLGNPTDLAKTGDVIKAMVEDITREASGEILDNKEVRKAIGNAAGKMYRKRCMA